MTIKQRIINWFIDKQTEELIRKVRTERIDELEKLFDKKTIKEVLWEMVFTYDIVAPIDLHKRYTIYAKLNSDPDFKLLFKSKYAKNYMAYFNAKNDEDRNILKGRMLELIDITQTMDVAKDKLENWDEVEKLKSKKLILKKDIQENILTN
jgi:hypothetical protein